MPQLHFADILDLFDDINREIADQWLALGLPEPTKQELNTMRQRLVMVDGERETLAAWLDSRALVVDLSKRTIKILDNA